MKLATAEVIPYALPFRSPYVTARGRLERREMALLRLRSAEGEVGLGEAVPLSLRGGAPLATVVRELRALTELERLDEAAVAAAPLSAPARCAALTALLDLRARLGEPTSEARLSFSSDSGGKLSRTGGDGGDAATAGGGAGVPCNATLVAGEPAAVAAEAVEWAAAGFETFKLKLGAGDDVGQVREVREALGGAARIRVDVNAAWDLETAKRRLAALQPLGIELVEQPVATLAEMAVLAAATALPLAADESVTSRAEAERAAAAKACACTGVKLSKVGGPGEALAIAAALPTYLSSALDGPVGIAAAARLALELRRRYPERPQLAHGLATQRLFATGVARVESELRGGRLHPPPGPGLGVELDEEALRAHRL